MPLSLPHACLSPSCRTCTMPPPHPQTNPGSPPHHPLLLCFSLHLAAATALPGPTSPYCGCSQWRSHNIVALQHDGLQQEEADAVAALLAAASGLSSEDMHASSLYPAGAFFTPPAWFCPCSLHPQWLYLGGLADAEDVAAFCASLSATNCHIYFQAAMRTSLQADYKAGQWLCCNAITTHCSHVLLTIVCSSTLAFATQQFLPPAWQEFSISTSTPLVFATPVPVPNKGLLSCQALGRRQSTW